MAKIGASFQSLTQVRITFSIFQIFNYINF